MLNRKSAWLRAAAPAAALALALTACSSDDSGGENGTDDAANSEENDPWADAESDEDTTPEDEPEPEPTAHEQFEGMEPVLEGMAYGDFAGPVTYEGAEFWVKVEGVDTGANADWPRDAFADPDSVDGTKPAYLRMTFVHVGGEELPDGDPIRRSQLLTAEGEAAEGVTLIGVQMPGGCERGTRSAAFSLGVETELCETYMLPEDAEPGDVQMYLEDVQLTWTAN